MNSRADEDFRYALRSGNRELAKLASEAMEMCVSPSRSRVMDDIIDDFWKK